MFSSSLLVTITTGTAGAISLMRWSVGHHLVEQHQVEVVLPHLLDGIGAVAHGHHPVAFLLQKHQVGLEQFYLVVSPQ